LLVFAAHAHLKLPVGAGTGVTTFFFLSGYLITTLLRRERQRFGRISLRQFYLRRVFRILPPMYVVVAIAVALSATGVIVGSLTGLGITAAALQFTNFIYVFGDPTTIVQGTGVLWSLAIEEHFYLLFPILYVLLVVKLPQAGQRAALIGLCVMVLVWRCFLVFSVGRSPETIYHGTDTRFDSILFGCILAVAGNPMLDHLWMPRKLAPLVALAGAFLVVMGEQLPAIWVASIGPTLQGIGLLLAFTAIVGAPKMLVGRILEWRLLIWMGTLSYSFYLIHRLVQLVLEQHADWTTGLLAVASFCISLGLSQLMFLGVERPFSYLRRRLSRQFTTPV
jgi:peptidoglycan/LPS O-acetylase OafA/YrhL